MKALTLDQPWASLIAIGAKHFETRRWHPVYTGPLAIHAAKIVPASAGWVERVCSREPFRSVLARHGLTVRTLPQGAIVAVARRVQCFQIVSARAYRNRLHQIVTVDDQEVAFGDWSVGRWAWAPEDVRPLPAPIPARGSRGLWDVPEDIAAELAALLQEA